MRIDATRRASNFIRRKGGELFVWFGDAGGGSLLEHISTNRPTGREFVLHESTEGFRLWLEARDGIAPTEVRLRRRPWPLGPVEVTWEGGPGDELSSVNITDAGG
jgi:hypothetical protein